MPAVHGHTIWAGDCEGLAWYRQCQIDVAMALRVFRHLHVTHGAIDINFSHSSASLGPILAITPAADIAWVGHQSLSDALLVDPHNALWVLDGVVTDTTTADSTRIFARCPNGTMANIRDHEPFRLRVDMEPFTFRASFLRLELRDVLHLVVRDKYSHQHRWAPMAHQCRTHAEAPPIPRWRAVG